MKQFISTIIWTLLAAVIFFWLGPFAFIPWLLFVLAGPLQPFRYPSTEKFPNASPQAPPTTRP